MQLDRLAEWLANIQAKAIGDNEDDVDTLATALLPILKQAREALDEYARNIPGDTEWGHQALLKAHESITTIDELIGGEE